MAILFLSAIGLGLSFCAPPGVVAAEAVRRGFARGYWPALLVALGSLVGDAMWAIIALVGVSFLAQSMLMRLLLGIVGTGLLAYLSWNAIRDARKGAMPEPNGAISQGDFTTGAFLSLGNPFAVAFWLGVSGSVVSTIVPNPQTSHLIVFFSGFMLSCLLWSVFLAGLVAWGRQLLRPVFFRWVNLFCGVLLGIFGVQLFWNTMQSLLASVE